MSTGLLLGPDLGHLATAAPLPGVSWRVRSRDEVPEVRCALLREWFTAGVETVLVVDRAVPVRPDWMSSGALFALVADHLNLTGTNPLVGPNADEWGPRFPDLTEAWDPEFRRALRRAAVEGGVELREGVLAGIAARGGTGSELAMLRMVGADMASDGFVHEAIVARHAGRRIAGIAVLSRPDGMPGDTARIEDLMARALDVLESRSETRQVT